MILFRVDSSKEVALGHLKRCMSLAQKFYAKGVYIHFLTVEDDYARELLQQSGFRHTSLECRANTENDYITLIEAAAKFNTKVVIIDSYEINAKYRSKLMASGFFVVSIDDNANKEVPSHVIINGNLNARHLEYPNNSSSYRYLGIEYLILNPNFEQTIRVNDVSRMDNILITMGGIDHYDLTTRILSVLEKIDREFEITAIVGPYYDNLDSIRSQVSKMKKKVLLVTSPPTLFPYMKKCSLAFSAGGQTLYELSSLGRPTIGISLWENQVGNVTELSKIGAIKGVSYSEKDFGDKLEEICFELIHDKNLRKKMSKIASSTIDGKGAERVSDSILRSYSDWIKHELSYERD